MQTKNLLWALLPLMAFAQDDSSCNADNGDNNDATCTGVRTVVRTTTSAGVPYVLTSLTTGRATFSSVRPVLTTVVSTSTNVGVGSSTTLISRTTDIGTTPTATNTLFATTTDVGLAAPFAYTTNSAGSRVVTYTGNLNPSQSSFLSSVSSSLARTSVTAVPTTTSRAGAMATALPGVAAAMVGVAAMML